MDYIVYAIPVFFLLIGLEVVISAIKKSELYRFNDAVTNISCGITQQVTGAIFKTALIILYIYIYDHWRMLEIQDSWYVWVLLFIGIDFFYYWLHRSTHEINLFWGTHIVHHQSEEYNFTVALRQSSFQSFIGTFFYLPLALIGFHPAAFITLNSFQTLYQFWIHTKTIDKMPGWFEYIFNTPSHHRVHHGRNPKYIDKNHGGTLIIFDRLFGSFQAEEEEVVFGVTKNLNSWNPVWANFDYYKDVIRDFKKMPTWSDRLQLLIKKPGWMPAALGGPKQVPEISDQNIIKYDAHTSTTMNYYILFHYVVILFFGSVFLFNVEQLTLTQQLLATFMIIFSVTSMGVILENKHWIKWGEIVRIILAFIVIYFLINNPILWAVVGVLALISILFFYRNYSPGAQKQVSTI